MSEQLEIYKHTTPKARKEHKCCECYGMIRAGEVYHNHSGLLEGTFGQWKSCQTCEEIREGLNKGQPWNEQVGFGELRECFDWETSRREHGRHPEMAKKFKDNVTRRSGNLRK